MHLNALNACLFSLCILCCSAWPCPSWMPRWRASPCTRTAWSPWARKGGGASWTLGGKSKRTSLSFAVCFFTPILKVQYVIRKNQCEEVHASNRTHVFDTRAGATVQGAFIAMAAMSFQHGGRRVIHPLVVLNGFLKNKVICPSALCEFTSSRH